MPGLYASETGVNSYVNCVAGLVFEPMSPASEGCVFSALRGCLHADDSKDFLAGITLPFVHKHMIHRQRRHWAVGAEARAGAG